MLWKHGGSATGTDNSSLATLVEEWATLRDCPSEGWVNALDGNS